MGNQFDAGKPATLNSRGSPKAMRSALAICRKSGWQGLPPRQLRSNCKFARCHKCRNFLLFKSNASGGMPAAAGNRVNASPCYAPRKAVMSCQIENSGQKASVVNVRGGLPPIAPPYRFRVPRKKSNCGGFDGWLSKLPPPTPSSRRGI